MNQPSSSIAPEAAQQLLNIAAHYGLEEPNVFGSAARNEVGATSDIDLLVEFKNGVVSSDNYLQFCDAAETILQRRVDVLTREGISPYILPYVLHDMKPLRSYVFSQE